MKQLLWDLFKTTGKIEYYLKYKEYDNNIISEYKIHK